MFPPVREPGTVIGEVTAAAAADTGPARRARRWSPAAPTPSSACSASASRIPGAATVVGGTFWQHTVVLDEPLIDPEARLRTLCHAVPGRWMMEGIGFYCGLAMRWFRDAFCQAEKARAPARAASTSTTLLDERAAAVPAGLERRARHLLQPDAGEPLGARLARLPGLRHRTPRAAGRGECFRAIEESAAYVARGHLEIVEEVDRRATSAEVVFTGGRGAGARCGRRSWPTCSASRCGIPAVKESTALGAAM